ncbi:MAG: hypothetical protein Q4B78_04145, partial [Bacillota bacterium]|nr:hypothetical protein [Bacillota bacterium]
MTFNMSDSYGLSIITIPNNQAKTSESAVLKLNNSNYKATWKEGVKGKIVKKNSSDLICVPIGNKTKSWSLSDFLTLNFTNVGVLNGRNINAEVKFTKLSVSARQGSSSNEDPGGYIGIGAVNSKYLVFGLTMTSGYGYRARKNVDYTVKITWADTGEVVNYPFFQSVIDIDAMADYYNEAWEAKSGYVMKYYKYAQNINSFSGNKVKAVSEEETTGDDRWFKTGIYAGTTGGIFSGTFDEGNCSTGLYLHSAYVTTPELFVNPVEKVNKNRVKVGEDFTYSVEHKMGVFYETQLTVYSKLIFTAPIPSDVDYISAKFLDGKGEDITGKGKLNYDSNRRVVTFEVGDEWRENAANYNGQVVSLKVNVKARDIKNQEEKTVLHKSSVKYEDSLEVDTNTVEVIIYQDINIQIVKRIRKADITTTKAHGAPTFLYRIDGKET